MSQHGCPERLSNRSKGFQEDGSNQPTMEVLVETLTGTAFEMTVSPSDTIFAIKSKIFRVEGIPVSQQHILYNLKEVEDSASLDELSITDGARLRLVLGLRGGPISTRRLPPPPPLDASWRDIERLLDTTREDTGHSGCKVTVLLVRDGERLSMLRMRENDDGSYSPLDNNKYSSSLNRISEPDNSPASPDPDIPSVPPGFLPNSNVHPVPHIHASGTTGRSSNVLSASTSALSTADDNAVTLGKMLALRNRMHLQDPPPKKEEIKKTRSEEHLTLRDLLDEPPSTMYNNAYPASFETDFSAMYDGHYIRYDLDCSFHHDRYTLLPPIGSRSDSEHSVGESVASEASRVTRDSVAASLLNDVPSPSTHSPYGGVGVCGGWGATHSTSALSLLGGGSAGVTNPGPPLSSSTSQLETLAATTLHRHPNTTHLHRSHEGLDVSHKLNKHSLEVGSERRQRRIKKIAELENKSYQDDLKSDPPKDDLKPVKKITKIRCGFCKKRLSIATVHKCRCGAEFCAPHRYAEVHGCAYDYKANAHQYLERANPLVSAPKLPKI